ncbi:MAG: hypothetical protein ACR2OO_07790 [Thermomicrobiales bacterium]
MGTKTYPELSFNMALDELPLGVAVLALTERGLIVPGVTPPVQRDGHGAGNGRAPAPVRLR